MTIDDDPTQQMMDKMRYSLDVDTGTNPALAFEAFRRMVQEHR